MKKVIIMRGVPGVGKTWYVEKMCGDGTVVCSADNFRMVDGKYVFDAADNAKVHGLCFKVFLQALLVGYECVVVDNTNIKRHEYENYVLAARLAGYEVEVVEVMPETMEELRLCARRNNHEVPAAIVAKMAVEFEPDDTAKKVSFSSGLSQGTCNNEM